MDKLDIGFFEELEGVLVNRKSKIVKAQDKLLKEKRIVDRKAGKKREPASKSELKLLSDQPLANPCSGCPYEPKVKLLQGIGDLSKAKLLVVMEKVNDLDILNRDLSKNDKFRK